MPSSNPPGLFIVGTDTEVGKTYITSMIASQLHAEGYRVGVYKPVASDCYDDGDDVISEDAVTLWQSAGQPRTWQEVCPQRFRAPVAPHLAAEMEGKKLDEELLRTGLNVWCDSDIVLVEGVGGLMTPISDTEYVADLAADFGFPLIVVASNMLGVINQTLQTLVTAAAFDDGLDVAGLVLNRVQYLDSDRSISTNCAQIRSRTPVPILADVGYQANEFAQKVDWMKLAKTGKSVEA